MAHEKLCYLAPVGFKAVRKAYDNSCEQEAIAFPYTGSVGKRQEKTFTKLLVSP